MRIRFPKTEDGWISLGKTVSTAKLKTAKDSTPRAAEAKKWLKEMEKQHNLAEKSRSQAEAAEKSEQNARKSLEDVLRRRGQALLMANRRDPNSVREAGYEVDETKSSGPGDKPK